MATPAQMDEKAQSRALAAQLAETATPAQLAEKANQQQGLESMATPAQLTEKAECERMPYGDMATPAQLAEKADRGRLPYVEEMATPAQLAEKGQDAVVSPAIANAATPAQLSEKARYLRSPPPLPPRTSTAQPPPPYTSNDAERNAKISEQWRSRDPRSSSTHSLVPSESGRDGRRTLLLVFIHGFMGTETSFQSFPAHVHNLLTITLAETHIVHTKIYPRYKSRKVIEFARDDFSTWLEPHENHYTEVVLLGHSMGGILGAEVALQKPQSAIESRPLRHKILGTINFDTPFLGMHPGVISSGLSSLFRPAPDPSGSKSTQSSITGTNTPSAASQASASSSSYAPSIAGSNTASQYSLVQSITSPSASPPPKDPFFNPPFPNDVRLPERKGWSNLLHFINKHSDGLTNATKEYFMSHLEFGGCMADYSGLKSRYQRIRVLEDIDDLAQINSASFSGPPARVRFVNYYTASTGIPKPPKTPRGESEDRDESANGLDIAGHNLSLENSHSPAYTPRIYVDKYGDGAITPQPIQMESAAEEIEAQMENLGDNSGVEDFEEPPAMKHIDSVPIEEDGLSEPLVETNLAPLEEPIQEIKSTTSEPPLPKIPPVPTEPEPIDLSIYTDKDSRKVAEKEQNRVMKAYQQAVKDRESAIKDRQKLVEKREKKARQEQEKQLKAEEKQRLKEEKEEEKQKAKVNAENPKERKVSVAPSTKEDKPKRDKKFCMLPPKYGGERDKCWVRVYMEGVDEVGAHCGLFFPGPQYESLVGDVGARIGKWVEEDATRRAILDAQMEE